VELPRRPPWILPPLEDGALLMDLDVPFDGPWRRIILLGLWMFIAALALRPEERSADVHLFVSFFLSNGREM
jgi:hypothetical protein